MTINTLTKLFGSTSYQPPNIQVWHPATTKVVNGERTLTGTAYATFKSLIYSGADYDYQIGYSNGVYFDAFGQEINGYYVQFWTPQVVQYGDGGLVAINANAVKIGNTSTVTIPGYYSTVTPPPQTRTTALTGWTGSAASVDGFTGDGNAEFSILSSSIGVVCGLVTLGAETGSTYGTIEYAIIASQGYYQVIELGITKTPKQAFTSGQVFTIQKQDTEVEYLLDGAIIYKSTIASPAIATMTLDASLYTSGDTINNASIEAGISGYGWSGEDVIYIGYIPGDPLNEGNSVFVGIETYPGSGIWTGTLTGTIDGNTGTFTVTSATRVSADGQIIWTFVTSGFTASGNQTNPEPVIMPQVSEYPDNIFYDYLVDTLVLNDLSFPRSNYTVPLTDTLLLSDNIDTGKGNYLGLAHSTENMSITTYSNFAFDGSCVFNGKTLFFNTDGLFKYGGTTDNSVAITTSVKTDKSNQVMGQQGAYSTQHRKRNAVSKVYLNVENTTALSLTVTADDETQTYTDSTIHAAMAVHPVKIGRGFDGVHWQLEVSGFNALESIEHELTEIRRRGK